jgi:hypothetical protein
MTPNHSNGFNNMSFIYRENGSWSTEVRIPAKEVKGFFFSTSSLRPNRLCSPTSLLANGYRGLFPREIKWLGCEVNHSSPNSVHVMNAWIIPPLLHTSSCHVAQLSTVITFMTWYLVKHGRTLTFTFTREAT